MRASEAAGRLFAVGRTPEGLARTLLEPLVEADARLCWRGTFVSLAAAHDPPLARAAFVVFDLETTGLSQTAARICEIGAVRIEHLEASETFETLVAPSHTLPGAVAHLTGLTDRALRHAPGVEVALRRFSTFVGDAVLVAHNARFDVGFVNRELGRIRGHSLATTVIDTVPLARTLLAGRVERTSLASLAFFFGVSVRPCHRALPDAQATAEVFLRLVEIAAERGATSVGELEELAAPRRRRIHAKRRLIDGAPSRPGVYLFCAGDGRVLYVGKTRNLRTRLRSYFHTPRQRAAVEDALHRTAHIEWRVTGSELAAALDEVRLIRALRPPANRRVPQPEQYVYLHRRGERVVLSRVPSRLGPIRRTAEARRAARALRGCSDAEFDGLLGGAPLPRLRDRLSRAGLDGHDLELRRLRRELDSLERLVEYLNGLDALRRTTACILAPALESGKLEAFVVAAGRVTVCRLDAVTTAWAGLVDHVGVSADATPPSIDADQLDELLVVASFLTRPSDDLRVVSLDRDASPGSGPTPAR